MSGNEQLYRPNLRGPLSTRTTEGDAGTNQWAGFVTVESGSVFATVSTPMVQSGALVFLQELRVGSVALAVGSGGHLVVNSIVDNTSFAVARAKGTYVPWDATACFWIVPTEDI